MLAVLVYHTGGLVGFPMRAFLGQRGEERAPYKLKQEERVLAFKFYTQVRGHPKLLVPRFQRVALESNSTLDKVAEAGGTLLSLRELGQKKRNLGESKVEARTQVWPPMSGYRP